MITGIITWIFVIAVSVNSYTGGTGKGQIWGATEAPTHSSCVVKMNEQMKLLKRWQPRIAKRCFAFNGTKAQYLMLNGGSKAMYGGGVR